ncbi:unnamed protein product [Gordionus sp. m RMFG-2023]
METQPVRKSRGTLAKIADIVQEFCEEEEETLTKEQGKELNVRLNSAKSKIANVYETLKKSVDKLREQYVDSKEDINPLGRYEKVKNSIKEVINTNKSLQNTLGLLPEQDEGESKMEYTIRLVSTMEKGDKDSLESNELCRKTYNSNRLNINAAERNNTLPNLPETDSFISRLSFRTKNKHKILTNDIWTGYSANEIQKMNVQTQMEIHKIIRKLFILRSMIYSLEEEYNESKNLPMLWRYKILKKSIKDVIRHPEYITMYSENVDH